MNSEEIKRILTLLALLALVGCAAPSGDSGGGAIAIKVTNAASFDPSAEHGRIEMYRVTVTGEGIDAPVIAEFSSEVEEGVVSGISTGDGRTVAVEAVNPNGVSIRAGEAFDVEVGGGITEVTVTMEAVPIFTNVAEGNTIDNTRLVFKIFSDPANPVAVREYSGESMRALIDASTSLTEIHLDLSTGMGKFAPALMDPGVRDFAAVDLVTGRTHRVKVLVVDGAGRRPAPLVSATGADERFYGCSAPWCAP